jgi:hypothetical protein
MRIALLVLNALSFPPASGWSHTLEHYSGGEMRMRRINYVLLLVVIGGIAAMRAMPISAQVTAALKFEAVSVKPCAATDGPGRDFTGIR